MSQYQIVVSYLNFDIEDMDMIESFAEVAENVHFGSVDGRVRVNAFIEARSAEAAIEELVETVHEVAPDAQPLTVELSLVTIPDVASELGLSRESIRLWTTGQRGPGNFPQPVDVVGDRIKVWAESDVWEWLESQHVPHSKVRPLSIDEVVQCRRVIDRVKRRWAEKARPAQTPWRNVRQQQTTLPVRGAARRAAA